MTKRKKRTQLSRSSSRSYRNGSKPRKMVDRQGKGRGKPFKKVEVVIPSAGANQPSTMVPASTEPPIKEPAPEPDASAKAGTQSADGKEGSSATVQAYHSNHQIWNHRRSLQPLCWIPKSKSPSRNYVEKAQESATSLKKL